MSHWLITWHTERVQTGFGPQWILTLDFSVQSWNNRSAVGIKLEAFSFDIVLFLHWEQPAFCCLFNLMKTQLAPLFGWFLRTSSHINRQGNWKLHSIRWCKLGQSHYKDYQKNLQATELLSMAPALSPAVLWQIDLIWRRPTFCSSSSVSSSRKAFLKV